MDIGERSRLIGIIGTTEIMAWINSLPASAWTELNARPKEIGPNADTRTLPAIFRDIADNGDVSSRTFTNHTKITELMTPMIEMVINHYPDEELVVKQAIIKSIEPNKEVEAHIELHEIYKTTHRVHWALEGDYADMNFIIKDQRIDMGQGDVIEINNQMVHSLTYTGSKPRYNLIADFGTS